MTQFLAHHYSERYFGRQKILKTTNESFVHFLQVMVLKPFGLFRIKFGACLVNPLQGKYIHELLE